jgi:hypothetical protein
MTQKKVGAQGALHAPVATASPAPVASAVRAPMHKAGLSEKKEVAPVASLVLAAVLSGATVALLFQRCIETHCLQPLDHMNSPSQNNFCEVGFPRCAKRLQSKATVPPTQTL